ncbi:MAG: heparinase II/III family protein [Patescibacteria group bacterium]
MKKTKLILAGLLFFAGLTAVFAYLSFGKTEISKAQEIYVHPRLLFTAEEIPAIRAKIADGLGEDDQAWQNLIGYANNFLGYTIDRLVSGESHMLNIPILAAAYQLSDESNPNKYNYRDKCKDALIYMADNYPVTNNSNDGGSYQSAHYDSERMYSYSLGFDMCFDGATAAERAKVANKMISYLNCVDTNCLWEWNSKLYRPYVNNGGVMAGSSTGLVSIALRGETADTALLDRILQYSNNVINLNMSSNFDENGAYNEGDLYGPWAMRFFIPLIEARLRYDGYDYSALPSVSNMINWLAYEIRPNPQSHINNLNDALYYTAPLTLHNTLLDWAQTKYGSSVAKYLKVKTMNQASYSNLSDVTATVLWDTGLDPGNPGDVLPKSELFPHRGLYYYRTGWPASSEAASDDTVFSYYSGKFYGGHAHADQGQFTLYSKGENFIVDNGYGATSSEAHNIIFIDGKGEHAAGSSIGTDGNIRNYLLNSFADFIDSSNKAAYDTMSEFNAQDYPWPGIDWSWGDVGSNPVLKANRYVMAVKKSEVGEYIIMFDDIDKDGANHNYDWTLHTGGSNAYIHLENPLQIVGGRASNKLLIYLINPEVSSLSFTESDYYPNNFDGTTKIMKARINAVNPEFFTLMLPKNVYTGEPSFTFNKLTLANGLGARLNWNNNYKDYILYNKGVSVSAENIISNAKFTLVRKYGSSLRKFSLFQGSNLSVDGVNLVQSQTAGVSAASDGQTVTVSDPTQVYVIYGPTVTSVKDNNGQSVDFESSGEYIYINTPAPPDTVSPSAVNDLLAS